MYILGFKNTSTQNVDGNNSIGFGTAYRRNSYKDSCGRNAFQINNEIINLTQTGMYELTVSFIVSAPAAGDVTIQLYQNGEPIPGAIATTTIATAATEFHTITIPYIFLVDSNRVLGKQTVGELQVTAVNTGSSPITISNVTGTIAKVVY